MNKKSLAIILSKIKTFERPNVRLEQYQTEAEIASQALWNMYLRKDVKSKVIADLGCGTGIFGLGALVLGAKKVYLVDLDKDALKIARENRKFLEKELNLKLNAEFVNEDVRSFNKKVDVVLQNPPFGVKRPHIDKLFLLKAMDIANSIYSFHKIESKEFINKLVEDNNFRIRKIDRIGFSLRRIFSFHRKKSYFVDIGLWNIVKKDL